MTEPDKNTLQYRENAIASARPEDLALMMYNGLLKFIARASEEIKAKSLEAAHNTLIRCQDIVFEFQYTLNMDYAISNNLMLLYDYLYNRLIEANAKKDCAILEEVQEFVSELRDTWVAASAVAAASTAAAAAAAVAESDTAADSAASKTADTTAPAAQAAPSAPSSTKAIYKRTGAPLPIGNAMPMGGVITIEKNISVDESDIKTAMNGGSGGSVGIGGIGGAATQRINPLAAAQYAKIAKAKKIPQEIISIASE